MVISLLLIMSVLSTAVYSESAQGWHPVVGGQVPQQLNCPCQKPDTIDKIDFRLYDSQAILTILNSPGYADIKYKTGFQYRNMVNWTMEYQPVDIQTGTKYKTLTVNWAMNDQGFVEFGEMYSGVELSIPGADATRTGIQKGNCY